MSETLPQVEASGNYCKFRFEEIGISIAIERMRQHSSGSISAEVRVHSLVDGIPPHVRHIQCSNLLGSQTKRGIAADLEERVPGRNRTYWDDIVETVTATAVERFRRGEPVRNIGGDTEVPAINYQLAPLLLQRKPVMIFGDGGVGKSLLAIFFALLMQRDVEHAGLTPTHANMLYLDWETDWDDNQRRALLLQRGMELVERDDIAYRRCNQPLADDIDEIHRIVAERDIGYIIIDSLSGATGDDLTLQATAATFFRALTSLGVGSLILTHVTHEGANGRHGGASAFGSRFWRNQVRSQFELRQSGRSKDDEAHMTLFHHKINDGKAIPPVGLKVTWAERAIRVERETVNLEEFLEALTQRQRIVTMLKHGAQTPQVISEGTHLKQNIVAAVLSRYQGKDFRHLEGGLWGLLGDDEDRR